MDPLQDKQNLQKNRFKKIKSKRIQRAKDHAKRGNKCSSWGDFKTFFKTGYDPKNYDFSVTRTNYRDTIKIEAKRDSKCYHLVKRGKLPGNERQSYFDFWNEPNDWSPILRFQFSSPAKMSHT